MMLLALRGLLLLLLMFGQAAAAYNLTPIYEEAENRLDVDQNATLPPFLRRTATSLLEHFSDPVHEAVTARIFGCTGDFVACGDAADNGGRIPSAVLDGLRWNDNPIFRITTRSLFCRARGQPHEMDLDSDPVCWATLFYDAQRRASATPGAHFAGPDYALVYRIHFGDLQFLHAMASWDGEAAAVTRAHLLAWFEFTYKVHDGELADLDAPIARRIPALADAFAANGFSTRSLFTPQIPSSRPGSDALLRGMALGSLLHALEDSYSTAHTERDPGPPAGGCSAAPDFPMPGRLHGFYAYNHQDSNRHKQSDAAAAAEAQLAAPGNLAEVGRAILKLFDQGVAWRDAAARFDCLVELAEPARAAGPGPFVRAASPSEPTP